MKRFFKSGQFKVICAIIALLLAGMVISALSGSGSSGPSTVVGVVFYPAQRLATAVSDKITDMRDNASGKSSFQDEIEDLKMQIAELQEKLVDYENLKRENNYYKDFLEVKEDNPDFEMMHAQIIARDNESIYSSFTINKGSLSGVKVNDCIIYGKYLVGVVVKVTPSSAVVRTILDPEVSVGAYEPRTGESSYTTNEVALAKQGKLLLANLSRTTGIASGDIVCTSGVGGVYPRNLLIGTVDLTRESGKDISFAAEITPGVEIHDLTDIFVVTDFTGKQDMINAQNEANQD